ncbi:hypothetical protein [Levilactobacillus yonginensis]
MEFELVMTDGFDDWFSRMKKVAESGTLTSIERRVLYEVLRMSVDTKLSVNLVKELEISVDEADLAISRLEFHKIIKCYWDCTGRK